MKDITWLPRNGSSLEHLEQPQIHLNIKDGPWCTLQASRVGFPAGFSCPSLQEQSYAFDSCGKAQNLSGVDPERSFNLISSSPLAHSSAPAPNPLGVKPLGGFGSKPSSFIPFPAGTKSIEVSLSGKKPGWIPLSPLPCALTMPDSVWWGGRRSLLRDPLRIQASGNGCWA